MTSRAEPRSSRRIYVAMRRLAVSEARKRPGRVIVTLVMIALGSGALTTALVLGASVRHAVQGGLTVQYAGVDIVDNAGLSSGQDSVGTAGDSSQGITSANIRDIAKLPAVSAYGTVYRTVAVAQAGDVVRGVTLESLNSNPAFRWESWSSGRAPLAAGEVGLTSYTLHQLGIGLGDAVAIGRPSRGTAIYRVVGIVDTHGSLDQENSTFGILPTTTAQNLSGLTAPNVIMIKAKPGDKLPNLIADINRVAPTGLPETTTDILSADRGVALEQINALDAVVTALAAVSTLVAAMTSATTAGASLATRRRSWALLRCVGGSGRQVAGLLAAESLLSGLLGGIVGVLAGVGLARVSLPLVGLVPGLPTLEGSSFTVHASAIWLPIVVALLLAAAGSVIPAFLAARIPPSAALTSTSPPAKTPSRRATALSAIAAIGGGTVSYVSANGHSGLLTIVGLLVFLAGFTALIPTLLVLAARAFAARTRSAEIRLGLMDVLRRPRAAFIEAIAIVLAVGMISLSFVALASVQQATSARLSATASPDLIVGGVTGSAPISTATVEQVAALSGVAAAVPVTFGTNISIVGRGTDGAVTLTTGTAAGEADTLGKALPQGPPVATVRNDTIYLPKTPFPPFYADKKVVLQGPNGQVANLNVDYVQGLQLPSLVSPGLLAKVSKDRPTLEIWIALKDNANRAQVLENLTGVAILSGELPLSGPTILDVRTASAFSTARAAALAILAIAVLVAVIGAAATAALSISERSREHATLRSLGLERALLGRMLATRVVFVGALAGLLGVIGGGLLGLIASRVVSAKLTLEPRTNLPILPVLIVVIVTVAAVRIAALLPIEKASYIPPSRALARA